MKQLIRIYALGILTLGAASAASAAPTQWHAQCSVNGNPQKEITVRVGESVLVHATEDYEYSVELRENLLSLRADSLKLKQGEKDVVNYASIQFKNELPGVMVLTSRVADGFLCFEMN